MRLIKPSFEVWDQEEGLEGIYKQIERAGRVCYKSEGKIAEGTAKVFVDRMIASGHGAMLEHGTVYMFMETRPQNGDLNEYMEQEYFYEKYNSNKYSFVRTRKEGTYVTTNYRVLVENGWLDDLKYQCEPTEHHKKRITVKFVCDRGVSHKEFVA